MSYKAVVVLYVSIFIIIRFYDKKYKSILWVT